MLNRDFRGTTLAGYVIALAAILMPFVVSPNLFYSGTNARYFLVISLVYSLGAIFAIKFFTNGDYKTAIRSRWLLVLLALTFIVQVISGIFGIDPAQSFWSDIVRSSGLFFIAHIGILAFLTSELLKAGDWKIIRRGFVLSGAMFSFLYIFSDAGAGIWRSAVLAGPGASFGNDTFAGMYILFSIVFTLFEISHARKLSKSFYLWTIALLPQIFSPIFFNFDLFTGGVSLGRLFGNPALVLGDARASSATMMLLLAYLVSRYAISKVIRDVRAKKIFRWAYSFTWIAVVFIVILMLFIPGSAIYNSYTKESSSARPIVWSEGLQGIAKKPILGWGPQNFEYVNFDNFNNDLYLDKNLSEIWFDRAHNIFIDTLSEVGIVGLLFLISTSVYLIYLFYKSEKREDAPSHTTTILGALIVAHLLQMQTAFEVVPTYFAWALILGYGLWLERVRAIDQGRGTTIDLRGLKSRAFGGILVVAIIFGSITFLFGEYSHQRSLTAIFSTPDYQKRLNLADIALSRPGSLEVIRRSSNSLVKGAIAQANIALGSPEAAQKVREEVGVYDAYYQKYLEKAPGDYRAKINRSYILLFATSLGEKKAEEIREIIAEAKEISPTNPLNQIIESISYAYEGKFEDAERVIKEGIDLNPEIEITQQVASYIEAQKESYPRITFLQLENL
ncbi:MAG: hypothetical protein COU09_02605 [Candidatus Harrisonbacteria bacterium CG10_big_fil_rev_8_21_14_0_10_44_23]|uniref:O-antigen ligase-related domain-containing protein n=1 Tax=Candidatus Harrisonbacteria bacterium CG10_big_fil_rev_8_21_14_0_10_44_23 TaxID=1974585 RepID=A0A2H0UPR6_9BACT|nr:MAG: hypothetical protein COU09_02605 [Candidatus Harrisonbacteria bacterium CG10_big_fil_rev_8_21_14_0_10_44_23]